MKKIVFSFLCAILAFTVAADDQADLNKQLSDLEKERSNVQAILIQKRRNAIRNDERAAKLAREILTLNKQLSEYLNTKPDIEKLNRDLMKVERQIRELKKAQNEQKKKNKNTK